MNYNESDSFEIGLEVRWCISTKHQKEMYFRFKRFVINQDPRKLPFFDIYDGYGMLPKVCNVMVINNITAGTLMADVVIFHCDYLISDCKLVEWKCRQLKKIEYQELMLRLLIDMLGRGESPVLSSTVTTDNTNEKPNVFEGHSSSWGVYGLFLGVFSMLIYAYLSLK